MTKDISGVVDWGEEAEGRWAGSHQHTWNSRRVLEGYCGVNAPTVNSSERAVIGIGAQIGTKSPKIQEGDLMLQAASDAAQAVGVPAGRLHLDTRTGRASV
jgi:hypothetical protein